MNTTPKTAITAVIGTVIGAMIVVGAVPSCRKAVWSKLTGASKAAKSAAEKGLEKGKLAWKARKED